MSYHDDGTTKATRIKSAGQAVPPRPNWSHPLPLPLKIPGVMDLRMLADVRTLIGDMPKATRAKSTWQYVEGELGKAASDADAKQLSVALQMVLSLEGVEFQPARSQLPNVRK
jgi:hypothetical protein